MPVAFVVFNVALFAGLAVYGIVRATKASTRSLRLLWCLAAIPTVAVVAGGLHRLAVQGALIGWLPEDMLDLLLHEWQIVQSSAVAALGIGAFLVMRHLSRRFSDLEWMVGEVLDRASAVNLDILALTPREREVLEAIRVGRQIDDKTLAEVLWVSPHTAHTHVQSLLRKTKLRDRRDLVALAFLLQTRRSASATAKHQKPL